MQPLESRRLLAATYYVSPSGNDAADGRSIASAWRTIARVNQKNWNAGDRLLFQGGKTFAVGGARGAELVSNSGFDAGLNDWSDTMGTAPVNAAIVQNTLRLSGAGDAIRGQDVTARIPPNQICEISA